MHSRRELNRDTIELILSAERKRGQHHRTCQECRDSAVYNLMNEVAIFSSQYENWGRTDDRTSHRSMGLQLAEIIISASVLASHLDIELDDLMPDALEYHLDALRD